MELRALLDHFTAAVEKGDGEALAQLFTEDGVYVDGFYGPFKGRAAIAKMLLDHFFGHAKDFKWDMLDPVSDGQLGYARYTFSYTSTMPEAKGKRVIFDGMSRFELVDGQIRNYSEMFDAGVALAQLDFAADRIAKVVRKRAKQMGEAAGQRHHAL